VGGGFICISCGGIYHTKVGSCSYYEPFRQYVPYMVHNATDGVQMVEWLRGNEHDAKQVAKTGAQVKGGIFVYSFMALK
jgi:hypothetical protein